MELFIDPKLKFPAIKVAKFLLKKKLGFRGLLDVIPLDASLVKGSHGRIPEDRGEWPVLISPDSIEGIANSTDLYGVIRKSVIW